MLPNISRSKSNETMKLRQLIEYNKRKIFLQKLCRKWGRETSSRPLAWIKKLNIRQMQVVCSLVSIYFDSPQFGIQWKQTVENFRLMIQRYAQF